MTRQPHRPPHLYVAGATYFITGSTYHRRRLFKTDPQKSLLRDVLKDTVVQYDVRLYAWVILSNHYHLLFKAPSEERAVVRFVKAFHGASAIELNKLDNTPGRQVWYQYRDRFPRNEAEFWSYFNYIHQNPVKHGYMEKLGDIHQTLTQYPFSSYGYYLRQYGEEFVADVWERYLVIDHLEGDDF